MPIAAIRRFVLSLVVVSAMASAQDIKVPDNPEVLHIAPAPTEKFPAKWYPRVGNGSDVLIAPVLEKPYLAEIMEPTPTQSTSGKPRYETHCFQARDRFGRTRVESIDGGEVLNGKNIPTKSIVVSDPVSHCEFHWMQLTEDIPIPADQRVAFVTCGPQTLRYKDLDLYESLIADTPDGTVTRGDTTTVTTHPAPLHMDGITVDRLRVTNTRSDESGKLKEWSTETWYSPDLRKLIRLGDDKGGYMGLANIRRSDPDPKLFYPPDGFRIEVQPERPRP